MFCAPASDGATASSTSSAEATAGRRSMPPFCIVRMLPGRDRDTPGRFGGSVAQWRIGAGCRLSGRWGLLPSPRLLLRGRQQLLQVGDAFLLGKERHHVGHAELVA